MEQYVLAQEPKHRAKIEARVGLLAQEGPNLRRPYADVLIGPIRELRIGLGRLEHRVLYYFVHGGAVVLLHAFTKKAQQVPKAEIEVAEERMKDLNRRVADGEVLG